LLFERVAVCCSVLQCVAVCSTVLHCEITGVIGALAVRGFLKYVFTPINMYIHPKYVCTPIHTYTDGEDGMFIYTYISYIYIIYLNIHKETHIHVHIYTCIFTSARISDIYYIPKHTSHVVIGCTITAYKS